MLFRSRVLGVVEDPGGAEDYRHGGWTFEFDRGEGDKFKLDETLATDALLLGRVTYDIWAGFWPAVTDESDEIARALNGRPKYVVSATLSKPAWKGTMVIRDAPGEVARLRQQPGKPILLMGSSGLAQTLIRNGLIDEYRLWIHPVVLGAGKKLFRDGGPPVNLRLADSMTTTGGLVILTYQPRDQR